MPRRPTKEFWEEHYPEVERFYRGRNHKRAARVTASIWKKMKPSTRERYEKLRRRREKYYRKRR